MPPEQCEGQKVDARSDIYSFGCVMYECIVGKPPFSGSNPVQTILKHMQEDPLPLKEAVKDVPIPDDLEYLVMRCLRKEADERYQNMDLLKADLERIRAQLPLKREVIKPKKVVTAEERKKRTHLFQFASVVALFIAFFTTLMITKQ
jgi:serine/threonine protein kinase